MSYQGLAAAFKLRPLTLDDLTRSKMSIKRAVISCTICFSACYCAQNLVTLSATLFSDIINSIPLTPDTLFLIQMGIRGSLCPLIVAFAFSSLITRYDHCRALYDADLTSSNPGCRSVSTSRRRKSRSRSRPRC